MLGSHLPKAALVASASHISQSNIGNYLGLYISYVGGGRGRGWVARPQASESAASTGYKLHAVHQCDELQLRSHALPLESDTRLCIDATLGGMRLLTSVARSFWLVLQLAKGCVLMWLAALMNCAVAVNQPASDCSMHY